MTRLVLRMPVNLPHLLFNKLWSLVNRKRNVNNPLRCLPHAHLLSKIFVQQKVIDVLVGRPDNVLGDGDRPSVFGLTNLKRMDLETVIEAVKKI